MLLCFCFLVENNCLILYAAARWPCRSCSRWVKGFDGAKVIKVLVEPKLTFIMAAIYFLQHHREDAVTVRNRNHHFE